VRDVIPLFRLLTGRRGPKPHRPPAARKGCSRPLALLGILMAGVLVSACGDQIVRADIASAGTPNKESVVPQDPAAPAPQDTPATADLLTLTGTRLTQGNAVDCPTIRDDAGGVHSVSYLTPGVAIGARVTVSGVYGITTSCRGTVLVVQEESIPPE
jgi:hypothetical protein